MFSGFPSGFKSQWVECSDGQKTLLCSDWAQSSEGGLQVITVVSQGATDQRRCWHEKLRREKDTVSQSVRADLGFRRIKSLSSINIPFALLTFLYMRLKRAMRICMPRWCRPKMAGCSRRKRAVNRRQRPRARKYPWLRSGAWNGSKEAMMRPRSWGCTVLEASYHKWWENSKINDELIWSTF